MKKTFVSLMCILVVAMLVISTLPVTQAQEDDPVEANRAQAMLWVEGRNTRVGSAEIFSEDVVIHIWGPGYGDLNATDATNSDLAFLEAMPDLWMEPCSTIAEGDFVFVYCYEEATFENPLGELPPTGEQWSLNIFVLFRFEEGLVAEMWFTYNTLGHFQDLGALPPEMQMELPKEEPWDIAVGETDATPEEVRAVIQAYVDGLNAHDIPTALSVFAEDAHVYDVMLGELDVTAYADALTAYQAAQTDWSISTVEEPIVVVEGDIVFALDMLHGFFDGELAGIPGNGNEIFLPLASVVRVQDGKIVYVWSNYDTLSFITQLTAPPAEE